MGAHQDKSTTIIRTEYCELETPGLVSYRILHTVIKMVKQVLPMVMWIIPGISGPLMLGNNYRDSNAEDPDTQRKVNAKKNKKIYFLRDKKNARPNLTVKVLKRMHLDMNQGSFADVLAQTLQQVKLSKKNHCLTKTSLYSGEG